MQRKLLHDRDGQRIFAVVLGSGAIENLQKFAVFQRILAAQLTAIGAFEDAILLYFAWALKEYLRVPVRAQVEVASLIGDIAQSSSGQPAPHVHLVVGDGTGVAGNPGEGYVRPTLKVMLTESPAHLTKVEADTGLALLKVRA